MAEAVSNPDNWRNGSERCMLLDRILGRMQHGPARNLSILDRTACL